MRKVICLTGFMLAGMLCPVCAFAASKTGLVAWWKLDQLKDKMALDSVGGHRDALQGYFKSVEGVSGRAMKFDGYTTRVVRKASKAPNLTDSFTIEAWVAPQAYPWNWCAIVNQERDHESGYFFGIDYQGRVGLHLAINGKWRQFSSEERIPFMTKWSHIVGTVSKDSVINIYINGKQAAYLQVKGRPTFAEDVVLQIGRNLTLLPPAGLTRPNVSFPAPYSFDGIIDELKIYDRALSGEQIKRMYEENKPESAPPLEWRRLPQLPDGDREFSAVYTHLKFYPEWDSLWRVGHYPDIVVNFDHSDCKMVFWRGTNFNMNLVTENGKWVGDQSAEGGGGNVVGCCEHMSDKQCRYSHIRLIENDDARVVVHWRYALCDVLYRIANLSDGWGAWADEYYYIYPDGVAVRYFMAYGVGGCSITEPTVFSQPGEKPEDNVLLEAITLANLAGQTRTFSFETWPSSGEAGAPFTNDLPNANVSVVNLKSQYRPFYVYEPATRIIPYGGGIKEVFYEYSHFHAKNHWPTCLMPTDGRRAWASDRVTSSALTSPEPPMKRRKKDNALEGRFIMGLTNQPITKLLALAKSWLQPAKLKINGKAFSSEGYSRDERAYVLCKETRASAPLEFVLDGSEDSPIVNPAFVIRSWGDANVTLEIDGKEVKRGKDFRFGHRHRLEGSDLIVWIKVESTKPIKISLLPVE